MACAGGTAPLTRGRRRPGVDMGRRSRNSPAHAGTTRNRLLHPQRGAEQPRSRGDDRFAEPTTLSIRGTAPLTRGRRGGDRQRLRGSGNSPAHAGTTVATTAACSSPREQPRSRGDDDRGTINGNRDDGTAPLTRGRLLQENASGRGRRNSPAHAGTTRAGECQRSRSSEQPRSRGDDAVVMYPSTASAGTAPLTRGRLVGGLPGARLRRNSPAHAGTTSSTSWSRLYSREQPRSRGDDALLLKPLDAAIGTAPLTRGRLPMNPPREGGV